MATTVIEEMIVRLMGDATSFNAMLGASTAKAAAFAGKMKGIGMAATMGLTLPIVGVGAASVMAFGNFDQAMTESTSIMQVTSDQTKQMRDLALKLAEDAPQGPAELARSYYYLASAGLNAEESMGALPVVMRFATAGAFDMARATDLLTDAQSALGLNTGTTAEKMLNMTRVSDVLVKANTLANASTEQFSTALTSKAGAALKAYSKDVEEGVAVLAAFADQGVKAELAGNSLDRMTRLLAKTALKNADAHKSLGFQVYDVNGKMRNYADIIRNLEDIMRGMSNETKAATLAELGFEARVQQVILPLLGTSDAIARYETELRKAAGTTDEVSQKQLMSFNNQMKITWNRVKIAAIELGDSLAPAIKKVGDRVRDAVEWWRGLSQSTKDHIVTIAGWVAVAGPLLFIVGSLSGAVLSLGSSMVAAGSMIATVLPLLFSPPVLAIAGVIALGIAYQKLWNYVYENSRIAGTTVADFNMTLERSEVLNNQLLEVERKRAAERLKEAMRNSDIKSQKEAVGKLLEQETRRLNDVTKQTEDAMAKVEDLNTKWNRFSGNKQLELEAQLLAETKQKLDQQRAAVENLTNTYDTLAAKEAAAADAIAPLKWYVASDAVKILNNTLSRFDNDKVRELFSESNNDPIYKMGQAYEWLGTKVEELQKIQEKSEGVGKKLKQRAEALTSQYSTPEMRADKTKQELREMFDMKLIDKGTLERGIKQADELAKKEIKKKAPKEIKIPIRLKAFIVEGVDATSADALSRLAQYRETMLQRSVPKAAGAPAIPTRDPKEDWQTLILGIKELVRIGQAQLTKPPIETETADIWSPV